jgi:hypothetical protein
LVQDDDPAVSQTPFLINQRLSSTDLSKLVQISTGETRQVAQLLHNFLLGVVVASTKLFAPPPKAKKAAAVSA